LTNQAVRQKDLGDCAQTHRAAGHGEQDQSGAGGAGGGELSRNSQN